MIAPTFEPGGTTTQAVNTGLSWMERGQQAQMRRQEIESAAREEQEARDLAPVRILKAEADRRTYEAQIANTAIMEAMRLKAADAAPVAMADYLRIQEIPDFDEKAAAMDAFVGKYAWLGNLNENGQFIDMAKDTRARAHLDAIATKRLNTPELRTFDSLTEGMSPEEKSDAARVKLGLKGRQSGAAIQYKEVVGPDGRTHLVAVDPRAVGAQAVGSGERYGTGVDGGNPPVSAGASGTDVFTSLTPEEKASRVATAEEAAKTKALIQRERPKKSLALKQAEVSANRLVEDLDELVGKVTTATAGSGGVILEKFPGTTARDLEVNLNSIKAVLGFQALQAMREASPTGGALGQISDRENLLTQQQLGNLEIGQSPKQLIENIKKVRRRVIENLGVIRAGFNAYYGEEESAKFDPSSMTTEQLEQRLQEINKTPAVPR